MEISFLAPFLAGAVGILMKLPHHHSAQKSWALLAWKNPTEKEEKNVLLVFTKQ